MFSRVFNRFCLVLLLSCCLISQALADSAEDARAILEKAIDYWRGASSVATFTLTIHRPDFERTLAMKGWTRGRADGLFLVKEPPKDAGNATLKKGREMWTYNPKINRIIKLPPSMMSQSWMGSDFSNDDLAKSDSILDEYTHVLLEKLIIENLTFYRIKSIPKENAPVVWGQQILLIREDGILVRQSFFDEDMILVKEMVADSIEQFGDRLFPRRWEMRRADKEDHFTRLEYRDLVFDVAVDDKTFTRTFLQRGGR